MIERYKKEEIARIWTDEYKFRKMLDVELAVCEVMYKRGEIPEQDWENIKNKADFEIDRIKEIEEQTRHDVIAFVSSIAEKVGPSSRFIHKGLTSSDVLDTGLALQIKEASLLIKNKIEELKGILKEKAIQYKDVPIMGRTHGVHAEITSAGLKFLLYYSDMQRLTELFDKAVELVAVGKISGAVGNYAHISPEIEKEACNILGIGIEPVSTQIVQRDRIANYLSIIALIGTELEKISVEIRHLQKTEVKEMEEPFRKGQKGSSAMPHKRNPILSERITGLARLLRGYVVTSYENVVLWHERDISHSSAERFILPDATQILYYMLDRMIYIMKDIVVNKENMLKNIYHLGGIAFSQKLLLKLVDKGLLRDDAYLLVQSIAMNVFKNNGNFKESVKKDSEILKYLKENEIEELFDTKDYLKNVDYIFRRVLDNK